MANAITGFRILTGIALGFCPALSPTFCALYIAAGLSDILDGAVARATDTASAFGARLDTVADLVFVSICLARLLPALDLPGWVFPWTAGIAAVKLVNIAFGLLRQKRLIAAHTAMNRLAGALLLTLSFIDIKISAAAICAVATVAAVHEGLHERLYF